MPARVQIPSPISLITHLLPYSLNVNTLEHIVTIAGRRDVPLLLNQLSIYKGAILLQCLVTASIDRARFGGVGSLAMKIKLETLYASRLDESIHNITMRKKGQLGKLKEKPRQREISEDGEA